MSEQIELLQTEQEGSLVFQIDKKNWDDTTDLQARTAAPPANTDYTDAEIARFQAEALEAVILAMRGHRKEREVRLLPRELGWARSSRKFVAQQEREMKALDRMINAMEEKREKLLLKAKTETK